MSSFVLQLPPKNIATNNNDFGVAFSFPHLGVLFLYEYISVESFPGMHQTEAAAEEGPTAAGDQELLSSPLSSVSWGCGVAKG